MTVPVETLADTASVGDARDLLHRATHSAYPLVDDDGNLTGIVSRSDLLHSDVDDTEPVTVIAVAPSASAHEALEQMLAGRFGHVPVVEGRRLVGMVTRTNLVRARVREFEMERRERPAWRRRR